jgi:transposase
MRITDTQWQRILPLVGKPTSLDKRGPKRKDPRQILEGVLWILKTGAQWSELPQKYGAYQTVHRRYQEWIRQGVFGIILRELAQDMEERGKLSLNECFIDGTFASAKKGALVWDLRNVGKAPKSWLLQTKTLFQSPSVWEVLLHAKSPWWKQRLTPHLREQLQHSLLEIKHMTLTHSTHVSKRRTTST